MNQTTQKDPTVRQRLEWWGEREITERRMELDNQWLRGNLVTLEDVEEACGKEALSDLVLLVSERKTLV